jgi:integrase
MKGSIRKRGKDSWEIHIDLPRENGVRRQITKTVKGEKKAKEELIRLNYEILTGSSIEPSKLTVANYLDAWLKDHVSKNVSDGTYHRYERIVRCHIKPLLGHHKLEKLKPLHIQSAYSKWTETLNTSTIGLHHAVLKLALKQAVKWQLIQRNPCDAVDTYKVDRKEQAILSEAEIAKLLRESINGRWYLPCLLALSTGMRRGEIFGLQWGDVDLEEGIVHIRRSLVPKKGGAILKAPKSGKGRDIPLSDMAISELRRLRLEREAYNASDFVVVRADGSPESPEAFSWGFCKWMRKIELDARFHDLRHTFATMLAKRGAQLNTVSKLLGHSSYSITADIYSHVLPSMQRDTVNLIDNAIKLPEITPKNENG